MDSNDEKKGFSSESDILVTQEDPGIREYTTQLYRDYNNTVAHVRASFAGAPV